MKKLLVLMVFAMALTALSCEPEDFTDAEPQEQATGKGCDGSPGDKEGCPKG